MSKSWRKLYSLEERQLRWDIFGWKFSFNNMTVICWLCSQCWDKKGGWVSWCFVLFCFLRKSFRQTFAKAVEVHPPFLSDQMHQMISWQFFQPYISVQVLSHLLKKSTLSKLGSTIHCTSSYPSYKGKLQNWFFLLILQSAFLFRPCC